MTIYFFLLASLQPGFRTKMSHYANTTDSLMDSKITKIASIILCHIEYILKLAIVISEITNYVTL